MSAVDGTLRRCSPLQICPEQSFLLRFACASSAHVARSGTPLARTGRGETGVSFLDVGGITMNWLLGIADELLGKWHQRRQLRRRLRNRQAAGAARFKALQRFRPAG